MKKLFIIFVGLLLVIANINYISAEEPVSNDYCAIVYTSDGESKYFINIHDAWEYADNNLNSEFVLLHNVFTNGTQLEVGNSPFGYSEFTLDLNGFTIDGGGERIIYINSGIFSSYSNLDILTIVDSSISKTGKLTNGGSEYGGGIYVEGILNFNGGTLENCYSNSSLSCGGGIYAVPLQRDGQAHMIDVHPAGIVNIDGGHINNCGNNGSGGGINCYSWSTLNMYGGTVSNSIARERGGGINLECIYY